MRTASRRVPASAQAPYDTVELAGVPWPHHAVCLQANYNPDSIRLPSVSDFGWCAYANPCQFPSCRNAQLGIICTPTCCPYSGSCGNGLEHKNYVTNVKKIGMASLCAVGTDDLDEGVVVGVYIGETQLVDSASRYLNTGYALVMRAIPEGRGGMRVRIDAEKYGSAMRFLNRSCSPTVHLHELANGTAHSVVAITCRAVARGEEVTVSYGDDLWFTCRCGSDACVRRHLQHLDDSEPELDEV
ncbi:hypothetical protein PybrP1_001820 [[Pythium] brassicae (nom. inval.)]|nr:hypothetical protein PybrP1_001820 [[Pythium] brassicae (nom. inval.)]